MANLQEVWSRLKETQKKQKEIRNTYKDALANLASYQEIVEKLKILKDRKKGIEDQIKGDFGSEFDKLEGFKLDIQTDRELLSDMALTQLMKGETVSITDENDDEYEPKFSVSFKKV